MSGLTVQLNLREDNNGIPGALINSNTFALGDSFFVEILMGDIRSLAVGLTSTSVDITFAATKLQNIDSPFNPTNLSSPLLTANFPLFRGGSLDNNNGLISNLEGGSLPIFGIGSPLGINQLQTFSLLHFQAVGSGDSTLNLEIDLGQTGFTDGTLADPTDQNQYAQIISVNTTNSPNSVPEPSPLLGLLVLGAAIFSYWFRKT